MELVYTDTKVPVKLGDTVLTSKGESGKVIYFRKPHKPASEGKVTIKVKAFTCEYYVSVIGAEWINREDREDRED